MQVGTTKKIGKKSYIFLGEGKNLHECVMELKKFSFYDVHSCGLCQGTNLSLEAYVTQEDKYKYTIIRCHDCNARLTFGQTKEDPNVFYLRKNKEKKLDWRPSSKPKDNE